MAWDSSALLFAAVLCGGMMAAASASTVAGQSSTIASFSNAAVAAVVVGTFAVFTVFGLVQLILQALPFGPSLYAWGELAYIVLSFAAKANLGILAISQALVPGAKYDALLFHQFNESLLTCQDYETLAPELLVP